MKKMKWSLRVLTLLFAISSCNQVTSDNAETSAPEITENTTQVPDMHTSESSLDWDGTYKGTLPCADCEGIETTVVLNKDHTFERTTVYKGKESGNFNDKGKFSWGKDGRAITLEIKEENPVYKVKEGSIVLLDQEGKENTGELADLYILRKE